MNKRFDCKPILKALEQNPLYVRSELSILSQGLQPAATDIPGAIPLQVTCFYPGDIRYRSINDLRAVLPDVIFITDYDTPQQGQLNRSLAAALLGKSKAWQLDRLICQGGCVFLHFVRSGYSYDPNNITDEDYEVLGVAMVDPDLDDYRIVFQYDTDAGIVLDSKTTDTSIVTTVYTVESGALVSRAVNTFVPEREDETLRRWNTDYTS